MTITVLKAMTIPLRHWLWGWSWFDADKPLKTTSTDYYTVASDATCPPRPPTGFT